MLRKTKISLGGAILALCFLGNSVYGSNGASWELHRKMGRIVTKKQELLMFLMGIRKDREQLIAVLQNLENSGQIPAEKTDDKTSAEIRRLIDATGRLIDATGVLSKYDPSWL
jgi:hypothetical protein